MDLWRISRYPSLDGEGGRRAAARWNSIGLPIVYLATSPAGALLEVLVHLQIEEDEIPVDYTLLHVDVPAGIAVTNLPIPLSVDWKRDITITRSLGDTWLKSAPSALAKVPSAIIPASYNYLLNPRHGDAKGIRIIEIHKALWDERLFHRISGT